jgi:putative ABC transport system permease protein
MRNVHEWLQRLRGTLRPGRRDGDLEEELRMHLEMAADEAARRGLEERRQGVPGDADRRAALRAARLGVGGIAEAMDALRDQRSLPWLEDMAADGWHVLRLLRRNPLFASVAILTLAVGIGVTTALFSIFNAVLLRPLPYAAADRLVVLRARGPDGVAQPRLSGAEIDDLRSASRLFERVAAIVAVDGNLTSESGDADMERVTAANASDDLLPMLGVRPHLGRLLDSRTDDSADGVRAVLISHELWQRRYGGDPSTIGRVIAVNNRLVAVVGILPRDFKLLLGRDTNVPSRIDVWFSAGIEDDRRFRGYVAVARMAPGVGLDQARAELTILSEKLTTQFEGAYSAMPLGLHLETLQADTAREARPALVALMGTVAFVLLIACANVANLLLTRAVARSREMAMRAAIGARRSRLVRQLVTEGLVLGVLGGIAGLAVARWTGALVLWLRPPALPSVDITLDGRTLVFAIGVTAAASLLFSLAPAVAGARPGLAEAIKRDRTVNRSSRRLRTALVIGEVALSVVLLVGAGLMIRTMAALQSVRPGFDADNVLTMQAALHTREFEDIGRRTQFYSAALDRLRALPGVTSVSAVWPLPLAGSATPDRFAAEGADTEVVAMSHTTFGGYFDTMGIRLLAGRDFTSADIDRRSPVVIVDERFARAAWPDGRVIGRRLRILRPGRDSVAHEVIGLVGHVRATSLREEGHPQVYLPYHQRPLYDLALVINVAGEPMQVAPSARRAVEALGGKRPVHQIRLLRFSVDEAMADSRFLLVVSTLFAALALTLSAVGTYGVLAYIVAERRREISIRLALGATRGGVLAQVMTHGLQLTSVGAVIGLAGAFALNHLIASLLFGVRPTDPATLGGVVLTIGLAAALACWLPAWRASRLDPNIMLRAE